MKLGEQQPDKKMPRRWYSCSWRRWRAATFAASLRETPNDSGLAMETNSLCASSGTSWLCNSR